jgi:hypothetical protein
VGLASGHRREFPLTDQGIEASVRVTCLSFPEVTEKYVGHRGWVGVRLDGDVDWDEVEELLEDAYRFIAPAGLTALLAPRDNR